MNRIKTLALISSIFIIVILCSAVSISSSAENLRWTLDAVNPWSGVEGLAFVVSYFLRSGVLVSYSIVLAVLFLIGWGLYAILNQITKLFG